MHVQRHVIADQFSIEYYINYTTGQRNICSSFEAMIVLIPAKSDGFDVLI